ncbi:MAG TPA: 6-phosphofructokinase [Verrucomicrobiota bacterium]|nr:6-phosphofructokinase [Verrucomicrobiota bacterium]
MKAFLSHSSKDQTFVLQVASYLRKCFEEVFIYEDPPPNDSSWIDNIMRSIRESDAFILFVGATFTDWQQRERQEYLSLKPTNPPKKSVVVALVGDTLDAIPPDVLDGFHSCPQLQNLFTHNKSQNRHDRPGDCAREIVHSLNVPWRGVDDLPYNPHLFDYEKRIIEFFISKSMLSEPASPLDPATPLQRNRFTSTLSQDQINQKLKEGCPDKWPSVQMLDPEGFASGSGSGSRPTTTIKRNMIPEDILGKPRDPDSRVFVSASNLHNAAQFDLTLLEAGPRQSLLFPLRSNRVLNVGVIVLGGIAPGINAVIDAIVHRHWLYQGHQGHNLTIYGFQNGLWAFENLPARTRLLRPDAKGSISAVGTTLETSEHATEGGSMLGTWRETMLSDVNRRSEELHNIAGKLYAYNIDILYVIGGDGSMKAAHALYNVAQEYARERRVEYPLSVVAVPKTMDNDILWMWQSFGFASAVQRAREIVAQLHTEVSSNPRLCVLQLYGSDSGFVVSHTVLASATGHCDLALIPEQPFTMIEIAEHLKRRIHQSQRPLPYGLVVMAETAIPEDALACIGEDVSGGHQHIYASLSKQLKLTLEEKEAVAEFVARRRRGRRIEGQTDDILRQASLHLVSQGLEILLKRTDIAPEFHDNLVDWRRLRLVTNEPRHLLRAAAPSTSDITMAQRLGILAVDNALAGYTDCMISQWLTEYVLVPLKLVVLGRKRIPEDGIFWKSVIAKTGQRGSRLKEAGIA